MVLSGSWHGLERFQEWFTPVLKRPQTVLNGSYNAFERFHIGYKNGLKRFQERLKTVTRTVPVIVQNGSRNGLKRFQERFKTVQIAEGGF